MGVGLAVGDKDVTGNGTDDEGGRMSEQTKTKLLACKRCGDKGDVRVVLISELYHAACSCGRSGAWLATEQAAIDDWNTALGFDDREAVKPIDPTNAPEGCRAVASEAGRCNGCWYERKVCPKTECTKGKRPDGHNVIFERLPVDGEGDHAPN